MDALTTCEHCGYPYKQVCANPACVAVNPEAWNRHREAVRIREAEEAERRRRRDWAARNGYAAQ